MVILEVQVLKVSQEIPASQVRLTFLRELVELIRSWCSKVKVHRHPGNLFTSGTKHHLDARMSWLDFSGQRSHGTYIIECYVSGTPGGSESVLARWTCTTTVCWFMLLLIMTRGTHLNAFAFCLH